MARGKLGASNLIGGRECKAALGHTSHPISDHTLLG